MDENQNFYFGRLSVHVTAADEAIPIEGATVAVRLFDGDSGRIIAVLLTNESGTTDEIIIPAPSPELSQSPFNDVMPYAVVSIEVLADGYYPTANTGVPVFPGVTTQQNVNLIACPENAASPDVIVTESGAPNI